MSVDRQQDLGKDEAILPEMTPDEVVLHYAPNLDRLLRFRRWFRSRIDLVVISDLPKGLINDSTRTVEKVNGHLKRITEGVLTKSLPKLYEKWGCDFNGEFSEDSFKQAEPGDFNDVAVVEKSFASRIHSGISVVSKRIYDMNGEFKREALVLRRTF